MGTITVNILEESNQPPNNIGWLLLNIQNAASHTFTLPNFTTETTPPYSDPEGDPLAAIKIKQLPLKGSLELNGVAVVLDQEITAANLSGSLLVYVSDQVDTDAHSVEIAYSASDTGSNQFTTAVSYMYVNIAEEAASNLPPSTVGEGERDITSGDEFVFTVDSLTTALDPPYADPENNPPYKLRITSLPEYGKLRFNGVVVVVGQEIPFDNGGVDTIDILNGKLIYTNEELPSQDNDTFGFQISDTGSQTYSG